MFRSLACALVLSFAGLAYQTPALAEDKVVVSSNDLSVTEIQEYVDAVDRRLQKGRYDVIDQKERQWIIDQIAALRDGLEKADLAAPPAADLAQQAGEFEAGMIKIEEGGIVCRSEARVGSHRTTKRCYSRKKLEEDSRNSQDVLRSLRRPNSLPSGG